LSKMLKTTVILLMVGLLIVAGCSNQSKNNSPTKSANNSSSQVQETEKTNFNPTGLPIVNEPITVTVMYPRLPDHADFDSMWFVEELEKRTGIRLKIEAVESAGWEEKKSLAFATGDLPDIFLTGITSNDENLYGPQGLLLSLTDLINEHAPEAKKLFDQYTDTRKTFTFPDGSIYTMPTFNDFKRDTVSARSYINKQWLDNVGLDHPKNLDELYTVLKAFKEKDPNRNGKADEIPMSGRMSGTTNALILSAVGFVDGRHDVKNDKYVYVPVQPEYKEYLMYMNKLYSEGLLDQEYFSQTREQLLAKEADMRIGLTAEGERYGNIVEESNWRQYTGTRPVVSAVNDTLMWPKVPTYTRWGTFAITNKSEHDPRVLIRLLDYLYTLDGSIMVRTGPEEGTPGIDGGYKYVDVNGVKTFEVSYPGMNSYYQWRQKHTIINGPFYNGPTIATYLTYNDYKQVWLTEAILDSGTPDVARLAYPEVKYTPEEQAKVATFVDMDNYADQMEAKFIMGVSLFTEWDNYVATFNKMGLEDMIKIKQSAYDRWNSTK
jgi:putative aldouronate transport system substrate-binding protein